MIDIRLLNKQGLEDFIRSIEFAQMENIPISTHRALSHIANPRLLENDTLLLLAYKGDEFAGYLGALPDKIFVEDDEIHVAWLSCLWVNPNVRRMGVAVKLLSKANELWNSNLLITNFTPQAKGSYDKLNVFTELKSFTGVRSYVKMNMHQLMPNKSPKYNKVKFLLRAFDAFLNIFIGFRLFFIKSKYSLNDLKLEQVSEVDEQLSEFISQHNYNELTKRSGKDIEWVIKYPWLKKSDGVDKEASKYEFSSVSKEFELINFKVFDINEKFIGFVMVHIRDRQMQVPYSYFKTEDTGQIVRVLYHLVLKNRINILTIFHTDLVKYISQNRLPHFLKRDMNRTYLISEALKSRIKNIDTLIMQDGDGDSAFT